jgi:hypothetical protein
MSEISDLCKNLKLSSKNDIKEIIECTPSSSKNRVKILGTNDGTELLNILHRYMVYSTRVKRN